MEIKNNKTKYIYFNKIDNLLYENIWDFLTADNLKKSNHNNHRINNQTVVERPDFYLDIIQNIIPIPPKSNWKYENDIFNSKILKDREFDLNCNIDLFIDIIKKLLNPFKNKKVAVELSGGLDSGIIIEILKLCDIEPYLIGLISTNFEFRTERKIQNDYKKNNETVLIDSKNALPFFRLRECPPHVLPSKKSLFYYQKKIIADECKKKSIDILFNGSVGDSIFCDDIKINNNWQTWGFENDWFNEYIFKPNNISYSATNSDYILDYFFQARKNESKDPFKTWARNHFKEILPNELSNYFYKADYYEQIIEGVFCSENDLLEIYNYSYEFLREDDFNSNKINKILSSITKMNDIELNNFFSDCSYANWIYSLRDIIE